MTLDCATRNYRLVNHERYRKVGIWEVFTAGGDRLTDSQPIQFYSYRPCWLTNSRTQLAHRPYPATSFLAHFAKRPFVDSFWLTDHAFRIVAAAIYVLHIL